MRCKRIALTLALLPTLFFSLPVLADNGSFTASGGAFAVGTVAGQNISVLAMPLAGTNATLSFTCPISSYGAGTYLITWTCSGGSLTISSSDNSLSANATFASGSMSFSGSGGGKGGHVTYWYQFSGAVNGSVTSAGITQSFNGSVSQLVKTTKQIGTGSAPVTSATFGWNSAYSPVVVADLTHSRLVAADNITGANLGTYGSSGTGAGQFGSISGLAQDTSKQIYIADSALNRIARIEDLTGPGWTELGTSGAGTNQFNEPKGIAIDSTGKIWVADAGNNRILRFDDMTGKNWTAFGSAGTGANQFTSPSCIAFDSLGRIYVGDAGNNRLVRFDDLTGKNWTALTVVNSGVYGYPVTSPVGLNVLPSGLIQLALANGYLMSFTDMTGANPSVSYWGAALAGMSADAAGTLYVSGAFSPGLAQVTNASGTGYFASLFGGITFQPGPLLAEASTSPTPAAPFVSANALAFASQNVGEPGPAQQVTLTNLGAASLPISSLSVSPDFKFANFCPASLGGGQSCVVAVNFDPIATGTRSGEIAIDSTSVHPVLNVSLTGIGTAPTAQVLPLSLTFQPQAIGLAGAVQTATLVNTGTGPLTIYSITPSGDFSATSNCPSIIGPGNGCTFNVTFKPTASGARSGSLVIADDAAPGGSQQVISLHGSGAATTPVYILTPGSLYFPAQQISTTSSPQAVTLKNASPVAISLAAPTYPAHFKGTNTCGKKLAAGATCTFQIRFAPAAAGLASGTLSIPITGHGALTLGLAGTGTLASAAPALAFSPPSVDFGALQIGDNPSLNLVVSNTLGVPTGLQSITRSGSGAFTITANNCPKILAGGASCTIQITFQPTVQATYAGNLKFLESSGAITNVPLTGSATINGN